MDVQRHLPAAPHRPAAQAGPHRQAVPEPGRLDLLQLDPAHHLRAADRPVHRRDVVRRLAVPLLREQRQEGRRILHHVPVSDLHELGADPAGVNVHSDHQGALQDGQPAPERAAEGGRGGGGERGEVQSKRTRVVGRRQTCRVCRCSRFWAASNRF